MVERIWTFSNILSITRVLLVLPIAYLLIDDQPSNKQYIIGLIIVAASTDFLDGILARKLHQVTELGKVLDPVADKIAVIVVCCVLTLQEKIPLWFFIAAAMRDVLIFIGGIYVKKAKGVVLQSNVLGKWTVGIVSLLILTVILDVSEILWLKQGLLALSTLMLVASFVLYLKRYLEVMKADPVGVNPKS